MSDIGRASFDRFILFQEEVERLFRQLFQEAQESANLEGTIVPAADVFESGGEIRIEVELPGLKREEVSAYVIGNTLWIEGRKRDEVRNAQVQFHCMERRFGTFRRAIELPGSCNSNASKADFSRGVLRIRFQKITQDRRGVRKNITIGEGDA